MVAIGLPATLALSRLASVGHATLQLWFQKAEDRSQWAAIAFESGVRAAQPAGKLEIGVQVAASS